MSGWSRTMGVLALVGSGAQAQSADPIERIAMAIESGEAALRNRDDYALIAAARALDQLGARPATGEPDLAAEWRTQARAGGHADFTPPFRGRALGPAYRRGTLNGGQGLETEQVFLAGQKAAVALVAPSGAITLNIADAGGTAVCGSAAPPRAQCRWLPVFTQRVRIRLANPGKATASYYLISN